MPNKRIFVLLSTLVLFGAACVGTDRGARDGRPEDGDIRRIPPAMADVGPDEAKVLATVTAIYSERAARGSDPCAKAPCDATIRIDSVLRYGSSFPQPLSMGQHLDARFAFTLNPTDEVGLNIDESYPGLRTGQSFWAKVRSRPSPGKTSYVVYAYYPADE